MATDTWNPLNWVGEAFDNWFGGMGGQVASGIEGGFVAILKDMWLVIAPWAEIAFGILIAVFVLAVYFREDTERLAGAAIGAAFLA